MKKKEGRCLLWLPPPPKKDYTGDCTLVKAHSHMGRWAVDGNWTKLHEKASLSQAAILDIIMKNTVFST